MAQRLTRSAADTIRMADRVALVHLDSVDGWAIKAYLGGMFGFAYGSQSIMVYPTQGRASAAVRRLNADVPLVIESNA